MSRPAEVADRVWFIRGGGPQANVTVLEGELGVAVVDPGDTGQAEELVRFLRSLGPKGVVAVVNTHGHQAHAEGNTVVLAQWPDASVHVHDDAAPQVPGADRGFSSVQVVDLGDRVAELVHPGRGHTSGDVVVRLADADVLVAGDLVSGVTTPAYGPDCFPLEWPSALDFVVGLLTPESVVVPGHGSVIDQAAVRTQGSDVGTVAETVFDLASRGVPVDEALRQADWPFPPEDLLEAVRRGYTHVPRTSRRLPLV
jgi:glyoxylase-like metal-dependent hydrolase (beta-lactamase superfamily II)